MKDIGSRDKVDNIMMIRKVFLWINGNFFDIYLNNILLIEFLVLRIVINNVDDCFENFVFLFLIGRYVKGIV